MGGKIDLSRLSLGNMGIDLGSGEIDMTKELLNRLGEALVESVVAEARKDLAKRGIPSRCSSVVVAPLTSA